MSEESPNRVGDLEPAAFIDSDGHIVFDADDPVFEWQKPVGLKRVEPMTTGVPEVYSEVSRILGEEKTVEPLVRPDQFFDRLMRIVEEHRHRDEDASAAGNEKERYACESVADVIYDAVMQWKLQIKELTQGGSGE